MDQVPTSSRLVNRNILAASGRSSMRLEPEIWDALFEICRRENIAMAELVRKVDGGREVGGRTSAIRVFAFNYFREAVTEEGHRRAGHGNSRRVISEAELTMATDEFVGQLGPV